MRNAPYGWDTYTHTEVVPKPAPITWTWHLGPVRPKEPLVPPDPGPDASLDPRIGKAQINYPAPERQTITMQLTADQQVALSISGEDAYGNPVGISGEVAWYSSDESIIVVQVTDDSHATAVAVGPAGTAAVTVTNDVNNDGTGDFMGSLAIDVVAGDLTEIVIETAEPTDKPVVNPEGRQ